MPCRRVQVEKLRNQMAMPTIRPSSSATWANTVGESPKSTSSDLSGTSSTDSGERSYSASSRTNSTRVATSWLVAGRITGPGYRGSIGSGDEQHPAERLPALDVGGGLPRLFEGEPLVDHHLEPAGGDVGQQGGDHGMGPGAEEELGPE